MKQFFANLSKQASSLLEKAKLTEHTFMIIVAIIIGVLAGFAAIGIRTLIETISHFSFSGAGNYLENVASTHWYWLIIIPALGGLIVGPIIHFFAPEAKGHGVPEVMQAILLRGGVIRPRVAIVKAIASAITIGTGGSVGREGPIIQIGSALGSTVGQFFRVPSGRMKTLVGCGAAAGIAAAFNAPIAGALFAVEIILMDFAVAQFSPIVISAVMATVVSHAYEGKFAAFIVPTYQYVSPYEIGFYFLLGAVAGVVSYAFIKVLYYFEEFFDERLKFPPYLKPVFGGLIIGAIAIAYPEIMGVGYDSINSALHGNVIWYAALGLVFLKIFATSITLGSGGSGGIFAPSLFMGAMLGAFFGHFVHLLFPEITAGPGAYALVAMGGLVAGTTRAPLTAIIIVFELTNDYEIILPLMITVVISSIISSKLSRESIYTLKLLLRNIHLKEGTEINIMESLFIKDVLTKEFTTISISDNFNQVVNKVIHGRGRKFPVIDKNNNLKGIILTNTIKDFLFDKEMLKDLLVASDLLSPNFDSVTPEDTCQAALEKMRKHDYDGLSVVDANNSSQLIGMVWRKDIQDAYDQAVERREITSTLASSIVMKDNQTNVQFLEGYSISEIKPPISFIGKSIREINIRAKYGVDVLSIKTKEKYGSNIKAIPSPDHIITKEDILVIAGEIKNINLLKNIG
ncbi:MAG: chloride channel protein [Melioribacteraceae bacterium]